MRRHRFDPVSLLFGGLFVLVATVFLLGNPDLTSVRLQWVWPMGVIVLGGLIILLALARGRGGEDEITSESASGPPPAVATAPIDPWPIEAERASSAGPFEPDDLRREPGDELEPRDPSEVFDDDGSFSEESALP
jgi:hypothetical protein